METISLTQIITYPIKSTSGWIQQTAIVTKRGLQYDRHWAICNEENKIITGRDYPALMDISAQVIGEQLHIKDATGKTINFLLSYSHLREISVGIFSNTITALQGNTLADQWFSDFLGFSCRLIFMDDQPRRPIPAKHGGLPGDEVAFPDQAPMLLVSEASLVDLNNRLEQAVGMERFRPNLVVKGTSAYAEDLWKNIRIGDCEMEVVKSCGRCVFTTIDPISKQKHPRMEPLQTLSTYRKATDRRILFGVYLIPRKTGVLRIGDEVIVLNHLGEIKKTFSMISKKVFFKGLSSFFLLLFLPIISILTGVHLVF